MQTIHRAIQEHINRDGDRNDHNAGPGRDHNVSPGDHGFGHGIEPRRERPSNWNRPPRHFDVHTYRRNFSAPRHFHWQPYHRPRGWYSHRWVFGETLPRFFWIQDYWLTDWWMFDLPIPPYGYRWVRVDDDALLVNVYTGEILEVVYDVFD